jgi:hypothetical protein
LSQPDVIKALHADLYFTGNYSTVNNEIFKTYKVQREGSLWIYEVLKHYNYKMLAINGDVDAEVTLRGVWKWLRTLGW